MTQTTYRVIGFGHANHGFFNQFAYCGSIGNACAIYNDHLHNPEMDGAVIIRVNHETWEVIQEFNSDHYPISVEYGVAGTFKVKKSPILELV